MFSLAAALPVGGLARACGGAGAWPCLGDRVPAAEPVAADAGGHCAVHDDGARCAKSVGGARARLVVRPRAFHAWAELDRHILYLSGGDRSEEHTSELQSLMRISYAVFCLKKKKH